MSSRGTSRAWTAKMERWRPSPGGGAAPVEPGGLISLRSWSAPVGVELAMHGPRHCRPSRQSSAEGSAAASVRGHLGPHLFSLFENLAVRDRSASGSSPSEFSHAEESRVIELGSRPMSWAICSPWNCTKYWASASSRRPRRGQGERGHGPVDEHEVLHEQHELLGTRRPWRTSALVTLRISEIIWSASAVLGSIPGRSTGISSMKTSRSVSGGWLRGPGSPGAPTMVTGDGRHQHVKR